MFLANAPMSIVVWSMVLLAAVVVGYAAVAWVRRKLRQPDEPASLGFSLEDLRKMHHLGQLTDEEFERARTRMTAGARNQLEKKHP